MSLEYSSIEHYAGTDPAALDPVFTRLVANLNPGQAPVLRIGGDTTDWTWWPMPGMTKPPGVTFRSAIVGAGHAGARPGARRAADPRD